MPDLQNDKYRRVNSMRIVNKEYWNKVWREQPLPGKFDPHKPGLRHYFKRAMHDHFCALFKGVNTRGMKLIEVGCGRSQLLPYFAREFSFEVTGLDYSDAGCEMVRTILARENIHASIYHADLFAPPEHLRRQFDVVFSYGLVEHFPDTRGCIAALGALLKPGGLILTIIPNMVGAVGFVQKLVHRPTYQIHKLIDEADLAAAHRSAGFDILTAEYSLSVNFAVCNMQDASRRSVAWPLKKTVLIALRGVSVGVWLFETCFGKLKPIRMFSPYITCFAKNKG